MNSPGKWVGMSGVATRRVEIFWAMWPGLERPGYRQLPLRGREVRSMIHGRKSKKTMWPSARRKNVEGYTKPGTGVPGFIPVPLRGRILLHEVGLASETDKQLF